MSATHAYRRLMTSPASGFPLFRCDHCLDTLEVHAPDDQVASILAARPACKGRRDGAAKATEDEVERRKRCCRDCEDWITGDPPGCRLMKECDRREGWLMEARWKSANATCLRTCKGLPDKWAVPPVPPESPVRTQPPVVLLDAPLDVVRVLRRHGFYTGQYDCDPVTGIEKGMKALFETGAPYTWRQRMTSWIRRNQRKIARDPHAICTIWHPKASMKILYSATFGKIYQLHGRTLDEVLDNLENLPELKARLKPIPRRAGEVAAAVTPPMTAHGFAPPVPGKIDVVYTVGTESRWQDNELRYSLRSVEKNFSDLGRVWIVGHKPAWLTGVVHLPMEDVHKHNKDANLIDKILAACRAGVSEQFVFCSDDQVFLQPIRFADMRPLHYENLTAKDKWGGGSWWRRMQATRDVLVSRGISPVRNFDSHCPTPYDRDKFLAVVPTYHYAPPPGYTINTLYCNAARVAGEPVGRRKHSAEAGCENIEKIRNDLKGKLYLGYNDAGLTGAFKQALQEMFPTPSRFEAGGRKYSPVGQSLSVTQDAPTMRIWSFWEGPKPPFVGFCQETLLRHNPNTVILDWPMFQAMRTIDTDVDLSHLGWAHRADWIRLYLLKHFGGLWLDADCIVLRSLNRFLDAIRCCWSLTYYEQSGHIGGGFMGSPPNSCHINDIYNNATEIVRSKRKPAWREILGANMESVLAKHGWQGFFKCDWHQFIPVMPHRRDGLLFRRGTDAEHETNFNDAAFTYMLSHNSFPRHLRQMTREQILEGDYFISYLFRRAIA